MTDEPIGSGRYADTVPKAPKSDPREVVRLLVGCLAVVAATVAVIAAIDRAWLDCAGNLDAGERFGVRFPLLVVVFPATLAALSLVSVGITVALRRKRSLVWALALGLSLAFTSLVVFAVAVPSPFDGSRTHSCAADATGAASGDIPEH